MDWLDLDNFHRLVALLYCKSTGVHYSSYLSHQGWKSFIIEISSRYFQHGGQNVSWWTYLSLPHSTHVGSCWGVQTNQSVSLSCRKLLILVWSISLKALHNSFSSPMKLLLIIRIFPLLAITLRSAMMNQSVSIEATTSIWTALLAKHVKRAPYLFISLHLSFTRNVQRGQHNNRWMVGLP